MKRMNVFVLSLAGTVAIAIAAARGEQAQIQKPAAQPAATEAKPTSLGKPENVKWSATTYEAATAEANKKVLETGKPGAVTGEIVDVSCYLQLGKRGEAHVACGSKCIANGQPIGLVDAEGNLYLLMPEEHHPRRDGQTNFRDAAIEHAGHVMEVNGTLATLGRYKVLYVSGYKK